MGSFLEKSFKKFLFFRIHIYLLFYSLMLSTLKDNFDHISAGFWVLSAFFTSLLFFFHFYNYISVSLPRRETLLKIVSIIPIIISLTFLQLRLKLLLLFSFVYILAVMYNSPFFKKKIQSIIFLKNIMISLLWSLPIGFVPALLKEGHWDFAAKNFIITFLYFFSVEIIWDVRDLLADRQRGVKTLPNLLGLKKTKVSLYAILSCIIALVFLLDMQIQFLIGLIPLSLFIHFLNEKRGEIFYHSIYLTWLLLQIITLALDI